MPKRGSIRGLPALAPGATATIEGACETACGALWDAVDLLLIHNEGPTGGEAPRGVLSPLVVLLAVSAWERFVYVLAQAVGIEVGDRESVGQFYYAKTFDVLRAASSSALPDAFSVTVYDARGKSLNERRQIGLREDRQAFLDEFNSYVELRNGVAHRVVPQRMKGQTLRSDAVRTDGEWLGLTINTSIARMVLAAYAQLVDQSIVHVCRAQGIEDDHISRLRLPGYWFSDDRNTENAHQTWRPGCLWGGVTLPRMP